MTGSTKLLTSGGGGVILQTESPVATDVTVKIPSSNSVLANQTYVNTAVSNNIGFRNRIINGGMVINQRNTTVTYGSGGVNAYCIDQFKGSKNNTGTFTLQQSTTAPTGFTKSLLLTVTGTESSLASNSFYDVVHYIEGNNVADLAWGSASAKTVTLSFWVRSSVTGIYSFELRNGANNRSITYNYTIAAANTWQQVTQTITGDTTGTWATDTGSGIEILFPVATGSSFTTGTTGVWQAGNNNASTSAINLMATNGATWYLTGVQLEVGTQATSFDFRSYGTELALCQRYLPAYIGYQTIGAGICYASTIAGVQVKFPVTARTAPTGISISAATDFNVRKNTGAGENVTALTFNAWSTEAAQVEVTVASGLVQGNSTILQAASANAKLFFTGCEL